MSLLVWVIVVAVILIPAFILLALDPLRHLFAIRRTTRQEETHVQFDLNDKDPDETPRNTDETPKAG